MRKGAHLGELLFIDVGDVATDKNIGPIHNLEMGGGWVGVCQNKQPVTLGKAKHLKVLIDLDLPGGR